MAKDARGHGSDSRGGSFQDVARQHQMKIARSTVKMPAAMAAVMGGMTPAQAHALIQQHGSFADKAMAADYAKIPDHSGDNAAANVLSSGSAKSAPVPTHSSMAVKDFFSAGPAPGTFGGPRNAQGYRTTGTAYEGPRTPAERFHGSIKSQISRGQYKP